MATVQTIYGQGNYGDQSYTTATTTTTAPGAPNTGFWAQPVVQNTTFIGSGVLIVVAIVLIITTLVARRKHAANRSSEVL